MTATCSSYLQGYIARVTRLDECGEIQYGACAYAVSSGFVSVEPETDQEDGEEISQTKADGTRCYYKKTAPQLKAQMLDIEMCQVDPEFFTLCTGDSLVLDDAGSPVAHGFAIDENTFASGNFALELWTDLYPGGCTAGTRRWGYMLWPWLHNGTVELPTIENAGLNFKIVGAETKTPNSWGTGPYNIQYAADGVTPSGLYTALSTTTHFLLWKTNLAPPTEMCGCQTLVNPSS